MNIKSDTIRYGEGNRAAEMRLASFVQECERNLDIAGLQKISDLPGRLGLLARTAISNTKREIDRKNKCAFMKKQLTMKLAQIDQMGFNNKEAGKDRRWIPLLREVARLRWTVKPDQEMYNLDLEIRNKIIRAAAFGVKI